MVVVCFVSLPPVPCCNIQSASRRGRPRSRLVAAAAAQLPGEKAGMLHIASDIARGRGVGMRGAERRSWHFGVISPQAVCTLWPARCKRARWQTVPRKHRCGCTSTRGATSRAARPVGQLRPPAEQCESPPALPAVPLPLWVGHPSMRRAARLRKLRNLAHQSADRPLHP